MKPITAILFTVCLVGYLSCLSTFAGNNDPVPTLNFSSAEPAPVVKFQSSGDTDVVDGDSLTESRDIVSQMRDFRNPIVECTCLTNDSPYKLVTVSLGTASLNECQNQEGLQYPVKVGRSVKRLATLMRCEARVTENGYKTPDMTVSNSNEDEWKNAISSIQSSLRNVASVDYVEASVSAVKDEAMGSIRNLSDRVTNMSMNQSSSSSGRTEYNRQWPQPPSRQVTPTQQVQRRLNGNFENK